MHMCNGTDEMLIINMLRQLHEMVWDDEPGKLEEFLAKNRDATMKDSKGETIPLLDGHYRGTTALGLAAQLGRRHCIEVLLANWADTLQSSSIGYFPLQEATAYGDRDIMRMILLRRHEQLRQLWKMRQPSLATALHSELPDFFFEMDWHFRSWVPFLAKFCPADRNRVWKRGNRLRVDSTIMGVEMQKLSWRTGNVSFLFHVEDKDSKFFVLDHDRRLYEEIDKTIDFSEQDIEDDLNMRMNTQLYMTKVRKPVDEHGRKKVRFVRKQAGLFGLGGDLQEQIGVYRTDVYDVPGIELITRYRKEHIVAREQLQQQTNSNEESSASGTESLDSEEVLSGLQDEPRMENMIQNTYKSWFVHTPSLPPPPGVPTVSREKYFDLAASSEYVHVGRRTIESAKGKKFCLSVWMADNFPLTVHQLMPFFELMTVGNRNFQKLQDFISLDLPPGFPVRIEIPIFAFLTAQITFLHFMKWPDHQHRSPHSTGEGSHHTSPTIRTNTEGHERCASIPKPQFCGNDEDWFGVPSSYQPGIVIKSLFKDEN